MHLSPRGVIVENMGAHPGGHRFKSYDVCGGLEERFRRDILINEQDAIIDAPRLLKTKG